MSASLPISEVSRAGLASGSGPPARKTGSAVPGPVDYRAIANAVLLDRQGRCTWPLLEMLEERARLEPRARRELYRLDLLNDILEYRESGEKVDQQRTLGLAERLDRVPEQLAREGWSLALAGCKGRTRYRLLSCSRRRLGWEVLGLPPAFAAPGGAALESLQESAWRGLLERRVEQRFRDLRSDRTFQEYARLKAVAELLGSHPLSVRIDRAAVARDRDALAERLTIEVSQEVRPERLLSWAAQVLLPSGGLALGVTGPRSLLACPTLLRVGEGALHNALALRSLLGLERLTQSIDDIRGRLSRPSARRIEPILHRVAASVQSRALSRHQTAVELSAHSALAARVQGVSGSELRSVEGHDSLGRLVSELTFGGALRNYRLSCDLAEDQGNSPLV